MGWSVMLSGYRTWLFQNEPVIVSTGTVGGPFEARGKIPEDFDLLHGDIWLRQDSFEKAQKVLIEEACQKAMEKASVQQEQALAGTFYLIWRFIRAIEKRDAKPNEDLH